MAVKKIKPKFKKGPIHLSLRDIRTGHIIGETNSTILPVPGQVCNYTILDILGFEYMVILEWEKESE